MDRSFRQTMAALHTRSGLLPGWLLYAIFLFGTTAFFQSEISAWMTPEVRDAPVTRKALDRAWAFLNEKAPDAERWMISLPGGMRPELFSVSWIPREDASARHGEVVLDMVTGHEVTVRETRGGNFLYRFHFDLHYIPVAWSRLIVSIAALAMLVGILSGVIIHKKIFGDFFLLRFGKAQRSWLDAHNVTAVLALPFHLMITYTGLVTLLFTLMPWAISANYPSVDAFYEALHETGPRQEATGKHAALLPLPILIDRAARIYGDARPSSITIDNPGDASATVVTWPRDDTIFRGHGAISFSGVSGRLLYEARQTAAASATKGVMIGLHAGRYSGPVLRWLYFLSGLAATMMIATGLVLWTVKRRLKLPDPARPHLGFRLVERLNIGAIVGAPAGIAAYFLANRLLPPSMAHRGDWEINSLFVAWGGLFVWTLARPAKRAWVEALAACGALYALVPLANAATTARGLIPSLITRDWVFAGFDLVMLAMTAICTFTAWRVVHHVPKAAPRRKARAPLAATS
ncbi:MAG: PepSY-associated TM helix domain-containing protein [Sphingomonas phyllosphaerae]|uniref:PepSY-associated TM helix domain-containing protein n=1 Tax=Sphingomonas phyllosphaerae TaxID=257003 RepID=UPI002FF61083